MKSKQVLGKGLSALISDKSMIEQDHSYVPNLPINQIKPNPYQPRFEIKPESLMELADSIREHGIIEPLIVTQKGREEFQLIAGERRWRAAKLAGLKEIPVVVKESTPQQMLELAIVENIQRADLNPIEEALAFKQLIEEYKLSHSDVAKKVGLSRPAVVNKIRLLNLPQEVKKGLLESKISEGHARALLGLPSSQAIVTMYAKVALRQLSVRATEELVRRFSSDRSSAPNAPKTKRIDSHTLEAEKELRNSLGLSVRIFRSSRGGKFIIPFKDEKEFKKIYESLI